MKTLLREIVSFATFMLVGLPVAVFAQAGDVMPMETSPQLALAVTAGFWIALAGFLIATVMTVLAIRKFGKSTIASVLSYLLIGTGIFFVITVFQTLGGGFFGIEDPSMDVWWHVMFFMAFGYYFFGLKLLIGLGSPESVVRVGAEKAWGLIALIALAIILLGTQFLDPYIGMYTSSPLYPMGVHHFVAFALAGLVGYYLMNAKKRIGMIGRSIANPMIIAVWSLAIIHLWELLNESWKVVIVSGEVGEGVEKIFFIVAAASVTYAAWRLSAAAEG